MSGLIFCFKIIWWTSTERSRCSHRMKIRWLVPLWNVLDVNLNISFALVQRMNSVRFWFCYVVFRLIFLLRPVWQCANSFVLELDFVFTVFLCVLLLVFSNAYQCKVSLLAFDCFILCFKNTTVIENASYRSTQLFGTLTWILQW